MPNSTRIQKLEEHAAENKRRQQERRRELKLQLADHVLEAITKDPDLQRKAAALVAALTDDDRDELQHAFPRLKPVAGKPSTPATPAAPAPEPVARESRAPAPAGKSAQRSDAAKQQPAATSAAQEHRRL